MPPPRVHSFYLSSVHNYYNYYEQQKLSAVQDEGDHVKDLISAKRYSPHLLAQTQIHGTIIPYNAAY
jgi:hypothetical protein